MRISFNLSRDFCLYFEIHSKTQLTFTSLPFFRILLGSPVCFRCRKRWGETGKNRKRVAWFVRHFFFFFFVTTFKKILEETNGMNEKKIQTPSIFSSSSRVSTFNRIPCSFHGVTDGRKRGRRRCFKSCIFYAVVFSRFPSHRLLHSLKECIVTLFFSSPWYAWCCCSTSQVVPLTPSFFLHGCLVHFGRTREG